MARRPLRFRQREITRALRAARAAGYEVDDVEIGVDGKIVVHIGSGGDNPTKKINTADAVLAKLDKLEKSKR
jgi:hypothetical protein